MTTPLFLSEFLDDPAITDVCVNSSQGVYIDRGNGVELAPGSSTEVIREPELRGWILEQLSQLGLTWDARHPFVDATLPTGHRLHAVFPPASRIGTLLSLRRLATPRPRGTPNRRWGQSPLWDALAELVIRGDSLLISGATGSGKTTLASDLLSLVPEQQRVIALEDTPELSPSHPHFLNLLSRPPNADGFGEVTLRTLLRQTLRMRPDRIILGECRGAEVLELLQALNTGHQGAMATLHANSPRDALRRVELLCLIHAGGALPLGPLRELIANGIQWIAQVKRLPEGRRVTELWRIEGREGDTILMRPMVELRSEQPQYALLGKHT